MMNTHKPTNQLSPTKKLSRLFGIGALLISVQVNALDIVLTDTGTTPMSAAQLAAFENAAKYWEAAFTDNITVNVSVAWEGPAGFDGALANAAIQRVTLELPYVKTALKIDALNSIESQRHDSLIVPLPIQDFAGFRSVDMVTMTNANAKALGISPGAPSYDGWIAFNNDYISNYDLDRSDGIEFGKLDFVAIAAHELGHVLGFISNTDRSDDKQNSTSTIYPTTLDLLRFHQTGGIHTAGDSRMMTAGPAEYYDGEVNNIPFSQGKEMPDPLCDSPTGTCNASHWRDDQGNLMDPTPAEGTILNPTGDDVRALDYVGYNLPYLISIKKDLYFVPIWWAQLSTFYPWCVSCSDSIVRYELPDFPTPPRLRDVKPPFRGANIAMHLGISTRVAGLQKRSATGYARFEFAKRNLNPKQEVIYTGSQSGQWERLSMVDETGDTIPPRLTEFYFESDSRNGSKFSFRAVTPESGVQFNANLGDYGGFRVSGFIDGFDDRKRGDADANMTLELLLDASGNINKGLHGLSFSIDPSTIDNEIKIHDFRALGISVPRSNGKR